MNVFKKFTADIRCKFGSKNSQATKNLRRTHRNREWKLTRSTPMNKQSDYRIRSARFFNEQETKDDFIYEMREKFFRKHPEYKD